MQIAVALDGTKRRDLEFFPGDDAEIVVTVYAKDGDTLPISVSDKSFSYNAGKNSIASDTTFPTAFTQRDRYSITGYVSGKRTTLAYGYLYRKWDDWNPQGTGGIEPLFVRNETDGGSAGSYFEGPGMDGGVA